MVLSLCVKFKNSVHLYGDPGLNGNKKKFILKATLTYMKYKNQKQKKYIIKHKLAAENNKN